MDLSKMNKIGHTKEFHINQIILDEQCMDTTIFIVLKGTIEVIEKARNSNVHIKAGEFFGGIPIIQDGIRLYTVRALEEGTTLFIIQASTYSSLIDKCPEVYVKVFSNLLNCVRRALMN